MTSPTPPPAQPPSLARADRQLASSVLAVFLLAGLVAVLGPILSYRSDVGQLQEIFRARVLRTASSDADVLARHMHLLQSELERLASRPEVDLRDKSMRPEQELFDSAHRQSTLFDAGVAIVDANGRVVWSDPENPSELGVETHRWFPKLVSQRSATVEAIWPERQTFLVAVPVLREGHLTGAFVGLFRANGQVLPPETVPFVRAVLDPTSGVLFPDGAPQWATERQVTEQLPLLPEEGAHLRAGGREVFAASAPIGESGLVLAVLATNDVVTSPFQKRFLLQMLLLISLQIGAVLLLSLYVRRTYGRFLTMERRALDQERLLALGAASSLIAHEVKNSLNGLQAAASFLAADSEQALPVKTIRGEVDRLKHLASSLLLFGKPARAQLQPTRLDQLVAEVVEGLRVLPETEEVQLETHLADGPEVPCDPFLLTTAVHNLARNAVEATVAAKDLGRQKSPRVRVEVVQAAGEALVVVSDNAGGPSPEVERRLFEPFVTGKPKGIGLGLSMTQRAMEAQGGQVQFERTAEGSRFTLRLPLSSSQPPGALSA